MYVGRKKIEGKAEGITVEELDEEITFPTSSTAIGWGRREGHRPVMEPRCFSHQPVELLPFSPLLLYVLQGR